MKYAVISDIHANAHALRTVLEYLDSKRISKLICLGDLVGYCAEPNRCIELLRERNALCIQGNHDPVAAGLADPVDFGEWARRSVLWTRGQLTAENREFLRQLPLTVSLDERTLLVHASLYPQPNDHVRLRGVPEAQQAFDVMREQFPQVKVCFFGHMHRVAAYQNRDGQVTALAGERLQLHEGAYYLLYPGSVGMSRDRRPRARQAQFLIYDAAAQTVEFVHLPHPWKHCYRLAREAGIVYRQSLASKLKERVVNWIGR